MACAALKLNQDMLEYQRSLVAGNWRDVHAN